MLIHLSNKTVYDDFFQVRDMRVENAWYQLRKFMYALNYAGLLSDPECKSAVKALFHISVRFND